MNRQDGFLDVCLSFPFCLHVDLTPHLSFFLWLAYKQPLLYNFAVTREVIKQIYIREGLQPPSLSTIRSAYASLWSQITTPGLLRNLIQSGQVGRVGVYGLQAYGIFKVLVIRPAFARAQYKFYLTFQVGEILGRRSLVGYDLH